MQQPIETETISIERIGGKFASEFAELLLHLIRNTHIKDALHQNFDGEEMGRDVFQIGHGLLNTIAFCGGHGTSPCSRRL